MSATTTIALIIILVVSLFAYAFVSQTLDRKRKQRQRLITALKSRIREFRIMQNGFPPGFLSAGLNCFLLSSLIEITQQLCELESRNSSLVEELAHYREQLEAARRQSPQQQRTALDQLQKAREVRALLQDLHTLASVQCQKGAITEQQLHHYESEIRDMALQISVDECLLNARRAEAKAKLQLAVHHYALARKLLSQANGSGHHAPRIAEINHILARLQADPQVRQPGFEVEPPPAAAARKHNPVTDNGGKPGNARPANPASSAKSTPS